MQSTTRKRGLNAPFGARRFLTENDLPAGTLDLHVLMHLLALGAF